MSNPHLMQKLDPEWRASKRWRHDMKNQLGIILGFSELLLDELATGDPRRGDVQEIHTAAERAMALLSASDEPEQTRDA